VRPVPERDVAVGGAVEPALARMEVAVVLERFLAVVGDCRVLAPEAWSPRHIDTVTTGSSFPEDLVLAIDGASS
jgi:hypothetical protein